MLSDLQIVTLEDEGYLIIDNLFSADDLWPVKEEFNLLVDIRHSRYTRPVGLVTCTKTYLLSVA